MNKSLAQIAEKLMYDSVRRNNVIAQLISAAYLIGIETNQEPTKYIDQVIIRSMDSSNEN